jgi:cobalt-zinc-cadmium efflux system protein
VARAHAHARGATAARDHRGAPPLKTALLLTVGVAALELAGGWISHSLALLADSAHVFMDAVALAIALAASLVAKQPPSEHQSYGFARFEILAALGNGILLFAVAVVVMLQAVSRLGAHHAAPEGGVMAAVAAVGLVVNVGIGFALARTAHADLNVRAALWHVGGDVAGAFAVLLGGIAIVVTHVAWVDPALSLFVAVIIVVGVVAIVRDATGILLQSTPAHASLPVVRERMRAVAGVAGVHDLHIWSVGTGSHVLSAHVLLPDGKISEATTILRALEGRLRDEFSIDHVTIQFECDSCDDSDRIVCTMPGPRAL